MVVRRRLACREVETDRVGVSLLLLLQHGTILFMPPPVPHLLCQRTTSIGHLGVMQLASALLKNTTLTTLDLAQCQLGA